MSAAIYTDINGQMFGPLLVDQTATIHRTGLVRVQMLDGSNPRGSDLLRPGINLEANGNPELFPRTIRWERLVAVE